MSQSSNRSQIHDLIRAEMAGQPVPFLDPSAGHPLAVAPFGPEEVIDSVDVLLSTRVTMGERVRQFEAAWAQYCGRTQGVMVNSGSSANLIMLAGLMASGRLRPGDEVLVPAVTWSTTLFPVLQVGLVPVMVDVHPDTICIDPASAAKARSDKTKAVMAVHLHGQPCDMDAFSDLLVLEDACGAHGSVYKGRRAGSVGEAAAFSFFFSHHITTIEGGIIVTDDAELADTMRSLRAHGWVRERTDKQRFITASPEIDPRFLFVSMGYNLRPTEIQGAFGIHQLQRLPAYVAQRRANHAAWCEHFAGIPRIRVFPEAPGTEHASFGFTIEVDGDRADLMAWLESHRVETRPVSGSNLVRQPAFRDLPARTPVPLTVADRIHTQAFFVGNSHAFRPEHGVRLAALVREWVARQEGSHAG